MTKKILIIGSYGRGNLGDDILLLSMIELLSGFEIIINSANDKLLPEQIKNKVKTVKTEGYSDLFKKIKLFFNIDYIIYGGGDLWVELYGDKYPRKSLWKMLIINFIAKITNKKVFYLGCGVGNLKGFSLKLAKSSANLADFVLFRESQSAELLGINKSIIVPDLSINLFKGEVSKIVNKKFLIGISILYFIPNPEKNFPILIESLANFINNLNSDIYEVILIPFLTSSDEGKNDIWASEQLLKKCSFINIKLLRPNNYLDVLNTLNKLDLMIGIRLHANILAILNGVPSIGISYRPKVERFFQNIGLAEFCLPIEDINYLNKKFLNLTQDYSRATIIFLQARKRLLLGTKLYEDFIKQNIK